MTIAKVETLIDELRAGRMIVLMDDEDRENEGDLVMVASHVRPEDINFMATHARGLICLTLSPQRCEQLQLPLMVSANGTELGTNFTVSIEAAEGVTTGISAADRARTVQAAVAPDAKASDIVQPGHVFPICAQPGGVLVRAGHTEAGCDLSRLAGFEAAAVIVEIMNEDGTMARRDDLEKFAEQHQLKMGTIADLIHYRIVNEQTIECVLEEKIETEYGEFQLKMFRDLIDQKTHMALVHGDLENDEAPAVRVHVADPLRDLISAVKPDASGWSLSRSLQYITEQKSGVALLLGDSFFSKDIQGLVEKYYDGVKHPAVKNGDGAYSSMYRNIGTGAQILRDLGLSKMRLLSNPIRFNAISGFDLEIVEYVACPDPL